MSSILYKKAAEIYASGRLGEVHSIDAQVEPQLAGRGMGVSDCAGRQPGDHRLECVFCWMRPSGRSIRVRFFRWRLFADYGSGLGGDLFVHLLSGIQAITGMNTVAGRAYSSGGLYHFKDGRDFPDFLETVYDYPGMQVHVHCNQNNDDGDDADQLLRVYGNAGGYGELADLYAPGCDAAL